MQTFDSNFIHFCRKYYVQAARLALFVVFFWFGVLKVVGLSPASALVQALFEHTISFMSFSHFIVLFGLFECLIGILFIIPGVERVVVPLLFLHMITTIMPLFIIPGATWSGFMVPTLEGQYIIKNLLVIAAAIGITAYIRPLRESR